MSTDNWIALFGVVIALLGVVVTVASFILTRLREDIQNLFRIKDAINKALSEFKQEVASEYVTYGRMREHVESTTKNTSDSIARIENQLQSLSRLEMALTHLAAKLNVNMPT